MGSKIEAGSPEHEAKLAEMDAAADQVAAILGGTPVSRETILADKHGQASTSADLSQIQTLEDLRSSLNIDVIEDAADYGDGFEDLDRDSKRTLVGQPLLLLGASIKRGDFGADSFFTTIEGAVINNLTGEVKRLVRFTDGGTGIPAAITRILNKRGTVRGVLVNKGLRASDYMHPTEGPATTYYLDLSRG